MKKILVALLVLVWSFQTYSQSTDLARIDFLYLPFSKSKNDITRYRALIQAPLPINKEKKNYLVLGLEYRYVDINLRDIEDINAFQGIPVDGLNIPQNNLVTSVQQMDAYLGYTWKAGGNWRFGVKAGVKLQSDLKESPMGDDFIYEGAVYAINDRKEDTINNIKHTRLVLGLTYSTTPGRSFPLPLINYFKEFKKNWTYTLGVPKTNVRWYMNDSHKDALQAYGSIDNVYANLQSNFIPTSSAQNPNGDAVESIQETVVMLGLGYEHYFTKHLLFYGYVAHSVYNDFRLENNNGDKIYIINDENSPYFRTGLKFQF